MKIAIIGGGISGLSTYLNLQKHVANNHQVEGGVDITIYETHDLRHLGGKKPSEIPSHGGGYGVAPNGMASLRRLDPEIHEHILRNGFPSPKVAMNSARGWTLGIMPFFDARGEHPECCIMVLREIVIQALYDRIPSSAIIQRKVVHVEDGEERATIILDDGDQEAFDLVIGADGVWSKARNALLGEKPVAEYKGLFTVGGFISTDLLPPPPETGQTAHIQTVMTFGPNGFFAYTPYTTGDMKANLEHITGDATLPPGKMAFWWSRSEQKDPAAEPDPSALKREIEQRHASWKDPTIHKIINNAEVTLQVPTWVLPKIPAWAGKRVVLVGDAAHALPSSSGQGVSQSIEDAEALSLLLAHNLNCSKESNLDSKILVKTFRQYVEVRKAHVERILDAGNRAGDSSREMNTAMEVMMYGAMWTIFKLFGAFWLKPLMNYDLVAEVEKVKKQT